MPDKVILIKEKKTWEALDYCRAKHRDLVSITGRHQQRWVQESARMANTEFVWLGMRYTCTLDLWFSVSDRLVCYDNWAPDELAECGMASVMESGTKKLPMKSLISSVLSKPIGIFTATSSLFSNVSALWVY
ncbi:hypothetical protein KUCAC02_000675 [Chaenocephalus aceratus]|uniref:Uncharacterized protein n=1 Tax=Chaenocephalus aceratus TaxID=36190 RepID=A0ACB9W7S8_CHAAC|nr:hypothetical protein KUCAC02_000675 [Chaenocephalus aceratus]